MTVGTGTKMMLLKGSTKNVKHARKAYVETPQLFSIILCEPGTGKSNAQKLAVEEPLLHQEDNILKSLIVQVCSRS